LARVYKPLFGGSSHNGICIEIVVIKRCYMAVIQSQLEPDQRTFLRGKKRGQTGTFRLNLPGTAKYKGKK